MTATVKTWLVWTCVCIIGIICTAPVQPITVAHGVKIKEEKSENL